MKKIEPGDDYLDALAGVDGILVVPGVGKCEQHYIVVESKPSQVRATTDHGSNPKRLALRVGGTVTWSDGTVFILDDDSPDEANGNRHSKNSGGTPLFYGGGMGVETGPKASAKRIVSPPGLSLSHLAEFVASPKTIERVIQPMLSDMQTEYFKALKDGRRLKAEWVRLRGYWHFWVGVGLYSIIRLAIDVWRRIV